VESFIFANIVGFAFREAGASYVLESKPRCVLVMQPASDDTEDARVVMTPVKNNDGEYGPRKAVWFEPLPDFNFEEFDGGNVKHEPKVKEDHLRKLFDNGSRKMVLKQAAAEQQEIADVGRSAAYEASKIPGRFSAILVRDTDGLIGLKPVEAEPPAEVE
jgi:hypothetical protein